MSRLNGLGSSKCVLGRMGSSEAATNLLSFNCNGGTILDNFNYVWSWHGVSFHQ